MKALTRGTSPRSGFEPAEVGTAATAAMLVSAATTRFMRMMNGRVSGVGGRGAGERETSWMSESAGLAGEDSW